MSDTQPDPAAASSADGLLASGTLVDGYRVIECLGAGGMGAVYKVNDRHLVEKYLALKLLHPRLSGDPEMRARFLQEGNASARLEHPHVVTVVGGGHFQGRDFLVMELLHGESLRQRLRRPGQQPLALGETLDILLPIIAGVHAAHLAQLVHRDLKPENIFLAREKPSKRLVPKVLDFGIAKDLSPAAALLTRSNVGMGTVDYMAPEQWNAGKVDGRADQFALGVILYECLVGQRPATMQVNQLDRPSRRVKGLPPEIDAIVARMMRLNPAERYLHIREVGVALAPFAGASVRAEVLAELGQPSAGETPPIRSAGGRRIFGWAAVLTVLLAAALAAFWRRESGQAALPVVPTPSPVQTVEASPPTVSPRPEAARAPVAPERSLPPRKAREKPGDLRDLLQ
jgi:serine/threonine-protein kinase